MTSAVIYGRVSTDKQARRGASLPAQAEVCRAAAARAGWPVSASYSDDGVSAGKPLAERPGLVAAIGRLTSGDVLLVAKRDRLFRADPFECALIERAVAGRGARIVSAAGEGTDDDTPSSILMRRILDVFAEYERLLAAIRTSAVIRSKRARSERVGQVPYGCRLGPDGKTLEADEAEQAVLARIRRWRESGWSLRAIAVGLNVMGVRPKRGGAGWSHSTILEVLRRCPAP